jgi:hypothetical protein
MAESQIGLYKAELIWPEGPTHKVWVEDPTDGNYNSRTSTPD